MTYKMTMILATVLLLIGGILIFCGSCVLHQTKEEITVPQGDGIKPTYNYTELEVIEI